MADVTWGKGRQLLELETVQRAIDESASWAGTEYARRMRGASRALIGMTHGGGEMESPIEAMFWAWFSAAASLEPEDVYLFRLTPQHTVTLGNGKTYRFDFVVEFGPQDTRVRSHDRGIPEPKVAIELDGHDFHERTKEQVAHRNERDRDAQADGWTILHFSGTELHRDPLKCAVAVLDVCRPKTDEWSLRVYGA